MNGGSESVGKYSFFIPEKDKSVVYCTEWVTFFTVVSESLIHICVSFSVLLSQKTFFLFPYIIPQTGYLYPSVYLNLCFERNSEFKCHIIVYLCYSLSESPGTSLEKKWTSLQNAYGTPKWYIMEYYSVKPLI